MNDQTRWRTDDAAPLQGKVTLEPAPSMASEANHPPRPGGWRRRASSLWTRWTSSPRWNPRFTSGLGAVIVCWPGGLGGVGLLSLGQFGAFLVDQFAASPSGAAPGCSPLAWWRWAPPRWRGANGCGCAP